MTFPRNPKLRVLASYQSDREVTADDRFIGPLMRLANRGHSIQIISSGITDPTGSLARHKVRKVPFPLFPSLPFLIQSFFVAFWITKKHCIDLFLVYREEDLLIGWLVSKVTNCRIVYYAHGDSVTIQWIVSNSIVNKLKVSVLIIFEKIFLPKADLIVTVSRDTKLRLLRRVPLASSKIVVVYNNILSPVLRSRPLLKKNQRIIGFVGHFSNLKGVETLLRAFHLLTQSVNDVVLVLVGDGPLKKHLENMSIQMALEGKVIFTGYIKNPLDFIRDFDVLVVPSLYDGCPSVILEAFSLDIPVLGSKVGGIPELLGNGELLFSSMVKDDIASKLELFLTSEKNQLTVKRIIMERKKMFTFDHTSVIEQLFMQSAQENVT